MALEGRAVPLGIRGIGMDNENVERESVSRIKRGEGRCLSFPRKTSHINNALPTPMLYLLYQNVEISDLYPTTP